MSKVKLVHHIELEIDGKKIKLSVDDAKELHAKLGNILNIQQPFVPIPPIHPSPMFPQTPIYPSWPDIQPIIYSDKTGIDPNRFDFTVTSS